MITCRFYRFLGVGILYINFLKISCKEWYELYFIIKLNSKAWFWDLNIAYWCNISTPGSLFRMKVEMKFGNFVCKYPKRYNDFYWIDNFGTFQTSIPGYHDSTLKS